MSTAQLKYAWAKAQFDTIKVIADAKKKPIHEAQTRGEISIEQWAEQTTEIEHSLKYWQIFDALTAAEKELVALAQNLMKTKRPGDYARVKAAFETEIWNEELKQKLIDLCFHLDARTV